MKQAGRVLLGFVFGSLAGTVLGLTAIVVCVAYLPPPVSRGGPGGDYAGLGRLVLLVLLLAQVIICGGLGGCTGRIMRGAALGGAVTIVTVIALLGTSDPNGDRFFLLVPSAIGVVAGAAGGFVGRWGYAAIPETRISELDLNSVVVSSGMHSDCHK